MAYRDTSAAMFDDHVFGEMGGVNPSITDSATYTFLDAEKMQTVFHHEIEGCYLYSRHSSPASNNLSAALAHIEGTEAALVTGSGMAAITTTLLQLCSMGDEIVSSRTIYGGTYAFLKNVAPRFGIETRFVDCTDLDAVREAMTERTRVVYAEGISNPLLEVADIPGLARIAHEHGAQLVIDNTFSPLLLSPARLGADIVVHSLTKYLNGASDGVGGAVCGDQALIAAMKDVTSGTAMLLGPVLDGQRAASIRKNLYTLPIRMKQHGENAMYLARHMEARGLAVHYPGLESHPHHTRFQALGDPELGFGGMLVLDMGDSLTANRLMEAMQEARIGLLAVSLGFYRTLFSAPGHSTSSEIPEDEQARMGLSGGMIRMSIGIEPHIEELWRRFETCLDRVCQTEPEVLV